MYMKKALCIICVLLSVIVFFSCVNEGSKPMNPGNTDENTTNHTNTSEKSDEKDVNFYYTCDGVLYRCNVGGGYSVPVCPDPLCKHNSSSCMFRGITETNQLYSDGERLFFATNDQVRVFSIKTGNVQTLYNAEDVTGIQRATGCIFGLSMQGDYLYFNAAHTPKVDVNGTQTERYDVYSIHHFSLETKKLNENNFYEQQVCKGISADKKRILWKNKEGYYSTTDDFKDKKVESKTDGFELGRQANSKYTYRYTYNMKDHFSVNMVGTSLDTGKQTTVLEDIVTAAAVGNDKLLVIMNNSDGKYIAKDVSDPEQIVPYYQYQRNALYLADADGANMVLLCEIPDEYLLTNLVNCKNMCYQYPYIGIPTEKYNFDNNGNLSGIGKGYTVERPEMVILNIETGEYKISRTQ